MIEFFKQMFSKISPFFKEAAQTVIGMFVASMENVALEVVMAVEDMEPDAPGTVKLEKARELMKMRQPTAKDAAINMAIEMAVAIMKERMRKRMMNE